jgi:hypothetical protein
MAARGKNDSQNSRADYMHEFTQFRAGVAAASETDPTSGDIPSIDFTKSQSANSNRIQIAATRTAGAGTVTVDVWAFFTGSVNGWRKIASQAGVDDAAFVTLSNLPACLIKLLVTANTGTWTFHTSDSGNNGHA